MYIYIHDFKVVNITLKMWMLFWVDLTWPLGLTNVLFATFTLFSANCTESLGY